MTPEHERRIDKLESAIEEIRGFMAQLTRVAVQQENDRQSLGRAFKKLECIESRLRKIEEKVPTLQDTSNLVRRWIERLAVAGASGGAVYAVLEKLQ